jgi:peptidoglycan hydrolase CwlO-like protein
MKNWIKHIIEVLSPNKWDTGTPKMFIAPREPIGYLNNYYVKDDSLFAKVDLLDNNFYVRDKEDALSMLKYNVQRKEYDIENAKKKLEDYQNKAKKIIELCGIIETDIDILQDEVDELNLLIAKNYPNES